MKIIGVTGNIGSGKSIVSKYLEEKKAFVINADEIGHTILLKEGVAYFEVVEYFGSSILDENKNINRKVLGKLVFSDKEKLSVLTKITHKHIISIIKSTIEKKTKENIYELIVIDAPLLIEANLHSLCNYIFVITSDIDIRIKRIISRDNVSYDFALKKIQLQKTNDELVVYGTHIINNNGSVEDLQNEINLILDKIL